MNKSTAIDIRTKNIADKMAILKLIKDNNSMPKMAKISFKILLFKIFSKIAIDIFVKICYYYKLSKGSVTCRLATSYLKIRRKKK